MLNYSMLGIDRSQNSIFVLKKLNSKVNFMVTVVTDQNTHSNRRASEKRNSSVDRERNNVDRREMKNWRTKNQARVRKKKI
jgi:hypothetical protein